MAEVIRIRERRHSQASPRSLLPEGIGTDAATSQTPVALTSVKEDIHRSILLLDIAAQRALLIVKEIADPSRRQHFEMQIKTIEDLLQLARKMAQHF